MSSLTPTHPYDLATSVRSLPAEGDTMAPSLAARSVSKRVLDLVGSALGLIMLAPLMAIVAVMVRLDSSGPILFRQKRMGLQGRQFWVLKFRTMTTDAEHRLGELESLNESKGGVLFKIKSDPRVTRLGRFLRRTSLDELPQLFNVLKGEMSLVGPRPLQMRDCQKLEEVDPQGYAQRLTTPPGVTGPWQVGGRSEVDSQGMLRLDLEYIEQWSLALDLQILCRTVVVVLAGKGAC